MSSTSKHIQISLRRVSSQAVAFDQDKYGK